ncbi:hydroxymethylglutaryl-CoA lyase [Sporosarcina pasteurii]|uniref:Hydroxymethylglutaryl-CoA lyase yngG n=1 Tax=Sporosarcina pasteurii TaxID=1474 RepID=A0A380BH79_SPOPA|nr:hydroxymethylglutaryl-CoA lyase [Sporosarcina pasteurii]MDS9470673.1 hydroxymethylglutaryl-CoA lyase [Sporosarcina pasteurii]QBQ05641.1 hydroxymethylglutaryl-CoA lyase [Sporosarcina pasteurii]SUJ01427.1 Hydroxymethylglutaryl-CoA lyase yngG [Sporosarcina pasteurii]
MFILPKNVTIIEVGPRDGLQNERNLVQTQDKLAFIQALQHAGIEEMELTSFVSPKWVPQMADAKEIVEQSEHIGRQIVLTPNAKGVELAIDAGAKSVAFFVGVSNSFNQKNINRTTADSMRAITPLIQDLKSKDIFVRACISTAFYCPYEGKIQLEDVIQLCKQFVELGVDELSVADTIGQANPVESYNLFSALLNELPNILITAHFHDTRKMALANIFASLQAGIQRFDTSAGGLGGCPFAPGATGNVATEDVVHLLDSLGIQTGIDIEKVCEAISLIEPHVSRPIETGMYRLYKSRSKTQ